MVSDFDKSLVEKYIPVNKQKKALKKLEKNYGISGNMNGALELVTGDYVGLFDHDDLFQAGMLGLVDAYKHYDPSVSVKFSTYAYYYIVGEVNKYIRECSSLKISKDLIDIKKKILKVIDVMTQKLGREPTTLELSLYLDVTEEMITNALISTDEVVSIDASFDNFKYFDDINAEKLDLREEIEKLSENEKRLIKARYYEDLTQTETSKKLGISQVQVSRNENKILKKLRTNL